MSEDNLRENLIIWFTINRKGEEEKTPCLWRLFQVNRLGGQIMNKSACLALNFEVDEAEESVELLMDNLKTFTHIRFCSIRFMKAKNDNNYLVHSFQNPFFDANTDNNIMSSVSSNYGNNSIGAILELSKENNDNRFLFLENKHRSEIESLKKELEKNQEIRDLKTEIENIKSSQSSFLKDLIIELKDPAKELINTLIQVKLSQSALPPLQEYQEPKHKDLDPYLDTIIANYGKENLKQMLGELAIIANENIEDLKVLRYTVNSKAKELINRRNDG